MNDTHTNNLDSGFTIENIFLWESIFKRTHKITSDENNKPDINIHVDVQIEDKTIFVVEKLEFIKTNNDTKEIECTITMIGVFKQLDNAVITDLKQFGRINGAAIIYPYIREYFTNLFLKAGLNSNFLPPVNFTGFQK